MTGTPRRDPRSNADQGTQLGAGTRFLASVFRLPVRAIHAIGRVGRRGWLVTGCAIVLIGLVAISLLASPALAGAVVLVVFGCAVLGAFGVAVAIVLIDVAPPIGRAIARAARFLWPPLDRFFRAAIRGLRGAIVAVARPVGLAVAYAAVRVARAIRAIAVPIGHAIALVARALAHAAVRVGHAIRAIAVPIGHAIALVARAVAHAAVRVGHAIRAIAVPIGHAIALVARALAHAAVRVGLAIRAIAVPIGHAIALVATSVGRAVAFVAVLVGRGIAGAARAVARVLALMLLPVGRGIARAASVVHRVAVEPTLRVLAVAAAALGRSLERMVDRITAAVRTTARWLSRPFRRLRHSVGVAAARARQSSTTATTAVARERTRVVAPPPPFSAEVFHNEYLPSGGRTVDAVITVTAHGDASDAPTRTAEVILVDCSGSMGHPWRKIRAARAATVAAIDALPDGASFAVVRANHDAEVVYPAHDGLACKDAQTAAEARRAVQRLWPEGGTAMGRWLLTARDLLATEPHTIGHAILLTDGRNESESAEALATARRACRGRFQCDCRGVGTDWDVDELRGIARELLGTVDIVADPSQLVTDFRAMAALAAAKRVDGVTLRVWTPAETTVRFIRQVSPTIEDLAERPLRVDARTVDYPTGAWSDESRDYHLAIELPPKPAGTEMLAARVSLVVDGQVLSKALVTATWTEDLELSTQIVHEVVHYTGQAELLQAVQNGLERRRAGDETAALTQLGEAARRAYETGNDATLQLIAKVVEIEDAPTGRVRGRAAVDDADLMALETRSTRTKRFAVSAAQGAPSPEPTSPE